MEIDRILEPFKIFGINLGLERIQELLKTLDNPHLKMPIIHVAGTNGKGSVCAYLSAILIAAGYKVGRYTSPHLINWNERICINDREIPTKELAQLLLEIKEKIDHNKEIPTLFEIVTAAAWLYFAREKVDIAIIEVGLGGRLDSTNVCQNPLLSIITSISWDHWQQLGSTLADITREKAGILKANCPAIIGKLPPEANEVIKEHINRLSCPTIWVESATELNKQNTSEKWANYQGIEYPLPLAGDIQLINSAIVIAAIKKLQEKGWKIPNSAIQMGMKNTRWLGRLQWIKWHNTEILIDCCHNEASALVLRNYIDTFKQPVTWVMGILADKDIPAILQNLLRFQDKLYTVSVANSRSTNPEELALKAAQICPKMNEIKSYNNMFVALENAIKTSDNLVVLCGSLYLVGEFLKYQELK